MIYRNIVGLAVWLCVASLSFSALPQVTTEHNGMPSLAPIIKNIAPSVVSVSIKAANHQQQNPLFNDPFFRHFFQAPPRSRAPKMQSVGSGVIIDAKQGIVITNHHVIEHADDIQVSLHDGRVVTATLIGSDPEVDLAVLTIPTKGLTALPLANSDALAVGDFAIAIGNPFGLSQTVTTGVISALERSGLGIEGYENFIQTDASINPGNSGGALVNLRGELIGINTAIISPGGGNVGIGFAIPSNIVQSTQTQIVKYGKVTRGRIGVSIQALTPLLREALSLKPNQHGVLITRVESGSPAQKAGLNDEDIIIQVDEKRIDSVAALRSSIGLKPLHSSVSLQVLRNNKIIKKQVAVEPLDDSEAVSAQQPFTMPDALEGITLAPVDGRLQVTNVEPRSPGASTGLREGDSILEVNRKPVTTIKEFKRYVGDGKQRILLKILRYPGVFYLVLN